MAGVLQSGGQGVGQSCPSVISAEAKADGGRWPSIDPLAAVRGNAGPTRQRSVWTTCDTSAPTVHLVK